MYEDFASASREDKSLGDCLVEDLKVKDLVRTIFIPSVIKTLCMFFDFNVFLCKSFNNLYNRSVKKMIQRFSDT